MSKLALSFVASAFFALTLSSASAQDWTGFYGGVLLGGAGGSYGKSDTVNFPGDGNGSWNGFTYGVLGGYNYQSGNIVYGGELTYSGSSIKGREDCTNPAFTCIGEISSLASLRGRVGYLARPDTMLYGSVGVVSARLGFATDNGTRRGSKKTVGGYMIGIGAERAFTSKINGRVAINHYEFNKRDYQTDIPYTGIGGNMTELELGFVFRF